MDISDIVRQLLAMEHIKQDRLAKELEVTQATVSRWLKGAEPRGDTRDKIVALARMKGLVPGPRSHPGKGAPASRFVLMPVVSWVSAGRLLEPSVQIAPQDFPTIAVADLGDGDFFALRVSGSSMDRISPDKSVIVVNRNERALQEGKPYVFAVRGEVTYKVWRGAPPRLDPFSTDPSNEPFFIDRRRDAAVIGRVRRSMLDL